MERLDKVPEYTHVSWDGNKPTRLNPDCPVMWSGAFKPPAIGEDVNVTINGIGRAKVVGYAVCFGWLGLLTVPYTPPAWWLAQNGAPDDANPALAYGAEYWPLP